MSHNYKADRERLEKMLDDRKTAIAHRHGANEFVKMIIEYIGERSVISRDELANIFEKFALQNPLPTDDLQKELVHLTESACY